MPASLLLTLVAAFSMLIDVVALSVIFITILALPAQPRSRDFDDRRS